LGLLTGLRRLIGLGCRFLAQGRDAVAELGFLLAHFRHPLGDLLHLAGALGDLFGQTGKLLAGSTLLLTSLAKLGGHPFKLLGLLADLLGQLARLLLGFGTLLLDGLGFGLGGLALGVQVLQLLLGRLDFLPQAVDLAGQTLFVLHGGAQPVEIALDGLAFATRRVVLAGEGGNGLLMLLLTLGKLRFQIVAPDPKRDRRNHRDDSHHGQSQQVVSQVSPTSGGFVRAGHGYPLCA